MSRSALALTPEDIEKWMLLVRVKDEKGEPDWERVVVKEAKLGKTQRYIVKSRWGTNLPQMTAVVDALLKLEEKLKIETEYGAKIRALDAWEKLGRELAEEPEWLQEEIARLAPRAARAAERGNARRVLARPTPPLTSITPEPKKPRK